VQLVACLLLHEQAHALAAAAACAALWACGAAPLSAAASSARAALRCANLLGNTPPSAWAAAALPAACARALRGGSAPLKHAPHVIWSPPAYAFSAFSASAAAAARAAVRAAGPAASLALALALSHTAAALPAWLVCACAVTSDILPSFSSSASAFSVFSCRVSVSVFGCGNFGLLLDLRDARAVRCTDYAPAVLRRMCAVTQVRGGQAAGVFALLSAPDQMDAAAAAAAAVTPDAACADDVEAAQQQGSDGGGASAAAPAPVVLRAFCKKLVNAKRGDMPSALSSLYVSEAGGAYPPGATAAAFIAHTRFATASLPALRETHPHAWCAPTLSRVFWVFRGGAFTPDHARTITLQLTHNGDLDALRLFKRDVGVAELGLWLERVLHAPNDTRGDSPKAAGMCDLLLTAGRWDASARWAYQECVASAIEDACGGGAARKEAPNSAPTVEWAAAWGAFLDGCMARSSPLLARALTPGGARALVGSVVRFVEAVEARLRRKLGGGGSGSGSGSGSGGNGANERTAAAMGIHPDCLRADALSSAHAESADGAAAPTSASKALRATAAAAGVILMTPLQLRRFLRRAALAFATQDAPEALRLLLSRASGSFGITLLSSTEPDTVAIAAWGQQMSVALHARASVALFGSEAAAMKVPIRAARSSSGGGGNGVGGSVRAGSMRGSVRVGVGGGGSVRGGGGSVRGGSTRAGGGAGASAAAKTLQAWLGTTNDENENDDNDAENADDADADDAGCADADATSSCGAAEFMTHRLDLDEVRGEVLRLSLRPRAILRNDAFSGNNASASGAGGGAGAGAGGASTSLHHGGGGAGAGSFRSGSLFGFTWQGLHLTSFIFERGSPGGGSECPPGALKSRLVPLLNNPLIQPLPALSAAAAADPVGEDIEALPAVLARVRAQWRHADGLNRLSATAFARVLLEKMALNVSASASAGGAHACRDTDVLLVGQETSLWLAEAFAADLSRALPKVAVRCLSANAVLAILGAPGDAAVPGVARACRTQLGVRNALVLVVSQSGQTFPCLHAARLLRHALGDRVWVLTGEFDTKLGLVVGQSMGTPKKGKKGSNEGGNEDASASASSLPFCCRIFSNFSGWRPAEPSSVAAAAAHATLSELLLFLLHAYTLELPPAQAEALLGLTLTRDDARCLAELRDGTTLHALPAICHRADGASVVGLPPGRAAAAALADWRKRHKNVSGGARTPLPGVHERLVAQGHAWAQRLNEGWHATVFSALYVATTILLQCAPMSLLSVAAGCGAPFWQICPSAADNGRCCALGFALRLLDVVLYIWIGWGFLLARRSVSGADALARRGTRTLIIADVPWVHCCLEAYVSKLFALSYGDNGLQVHGVNPADEFVHSFTHRVSRGVLIALGRPDGRVSSAARREGACLLAAMQAAAIHNAGCGPEVVSLGHNTYHGDPAAIRSHIVLPTHRRPFMCEFLHMRASASGAAGGGGGGTTARRRRAAARGASDPQSILASLGRADVIPATAAWLVSGNAGGAASCDRCAAARAARECLQCHARYCAPCSAAAHGGKGAGEEMRGHTLIGARAADAMRRTAALARRRVLARHAARAGRASSASGSTDAEAEAPDTAGGNGALGNVNRFGSNVGNAFPHFGARAAAVLLNGHGRALAVAGAPLGLHHARSLAASASSARARARWRYAITSTLAARNPWRAHLLDLASAASTAHGGSCPAGVYAPMRRMFEDVDVHSAAVIALETPLKDLYEGRFGSLERYVSFLVLFHAMALRVSVTSWPLPAWNTARSQSILRVASTAAPVSGADVSRLLAENARDAARSPAFVVTRRRTAPTPAALSRAPSSASLADAAAATVTRDHLPEL
jgi:hypothetical protein